MLSIKQLVMDLMDASRIHILCHMEDHLQASTVASDFTKRRRHVQMQIR